MFPSIVRNSQQSNIIYRHYFTVLLWLTFGPPCIISAIYVVVVHLLLRVRYRSVVTARGMNCFILFHNKYLLLSFRKWFAFVTCCGGVRWNYRVTLYLSFCDYITRCLLFHCLHDFNDHCTVLNSSLLTLWRPLLRYGYSYKASYARPG